MKRTLLGRAIVPKHLVYHRYLALKLREKAELYPKTGWVISVASAHHVLRGYAKMPRRCQMSFLNEMKTIGYIRFINRNKILVLYDDSNEL